MAGFGFGRERRIRRRVEFVRVQAVGERATSRHFVLLVARQLSEEAEKASSSTLIFGAPMPSRLGIVVTKKVGNSPTRNRIKRVCRECFRLWPGGFVPDEIDLVVIAREGAGELGLADVRTEWTAARAQLIKRCTSVLQSPPRIAPKIERVKTKNKNQKAPPKPSPKPTPKARVRPR